MSEVNTKELHPEVWKLFDRYVHGLIDRMRGTPEERPIAALMLRKAPSPSCAGAVPTSTKPAKIERRATPLRIARDYR